MESELWNRWLLVFALPVIIALFYITASAHFGYTPDDTYIYLQFAKNIDHGGGISFNAGEPTYGITSPLWLFILAAGGKMGVDLVLGAKVIDLLFASLGIVVFYLVAYETIRDIASALCATVAFSMNAWFLRWAGTGMETSLAVILVLAVILFCLRNEYYVSIFFAALGALVRPEMVLLPPLILADLFINSFSKKRALNTAAALIVIYGAIVAPWLIAAKQTFGTIIPNTALAKAAITFNLGNMLDSLLRMVRQIGATEGAAIVALLISGAYLLYIMSKHPDDKSEEVRQARFFLFRQSLIGIGWIILLPVFYLLTDVNVISRYLLLVTPLISIYAYSFVHRAVENSPMKKQLYTAVFVLTALVMFQNQYLYRSTVKPGIDIFEQGMATTLVPIGKWFRENTEPDARIVSPDIGAIGYYSERTIIDAAGLASPEFIPLIRRGITADSIIANRLYFEAGPVDYVVSRTSEPVSPDSSGAPGSIDPADSLILVFSKPFFGLSLAEPKMTYYNVYAVRKNLPPELE